MIVVENVSSQQIQSGKTSEEPNSHLDGHAKYFAENFVKFAVEQYRSRNGTALDLWCSWRNNHTVFAQICEFDSSAVEQLNNFVSV